MVSRKKSSLVVVLAMGLGALFIALGLMEMSRTVALARPGTARASWSPPAQPPPPDDSDLQFIAFFTDEVTIQITDLSGNVIGEGTHVGELRCKGNTCSHKTILNFTPPLTDPYSLEYKFRTRQAFDPEAETAVVAGSGTLSGNGQKERFSFTATFANNRDGTLSVTYVASRPDASFIIPRAPGGLFIRQLR